MIKLVVVGLAFICLSEAAITSLQLVLPEEPYNILLGGQPAVHNLDNSISSLANPISEVDKSSPESLSRESNESAVSSDSLQPFANAGSIPVAILRVKPPSASGVITTSAALSKGSLLISSTAQASANAANSPSSSLAANSTATIQHRILPAETIPLPITISTRPGLRTVIAPETITIHQPGLAKVGEVVQQIPTAVSHQQQTVVHNHARIVTPIVAPAVRTVTSQILRAYHTPIIYAPHVVEYQE